MRGLLRFFALALLASGLPACLLFTDPINSPPEVMIMVPADTIHPNQTLTFDATGSDRDGDQVTLLWSWVSKPCDMARAADWDRAAPSVGSKFPLTVNGHQQSCVRVIAQDSHGARSKAQTYDLKPRNREPVPTLDVLPTSMGPLPLYSTVRLEAGPSTDDDGDPLTFKWKAVDASGGAVMLTSCGVPDEPTVRCLSTDLPGTYVVSVEASDGIEGSKPGMKTLPLQVLSDQPPCIEASDPTADTGVVVLAATDPPRRFEVRQVKDDGHPFPAGARGGATFQWFTAREGSPVWTREIGYDRPTFDVGASRFDDARPGSVYRVRVEVRDPERELAPALRELEDACGDRAICKLPETCVRWMTWNVRFR